MPSKVRTALSYLTVYSVHFGGTNNVLFLRQSKHSQFIGTVVAQILYIRLHVLIAIFLGRF